MFVHTIKTSFFRKRKPADYEGCDVAMEFAATLNEGEDYRAAARELVDQAAIIVYHRIGMPNFAKPVFTGEPVVTDGVATATAVEAPQAAQKPAAEGEKKGRGRPPLSDEEKAKRAAEKTAETAAAKTEPQIRTNPENRIDPATGIPEEAPAAPKSEAKAPATTTSNIPEETPAPKTAAAASAGDTLTDAELQAYVQQVVVIEKKLTPVAMKAIFKQIAGVERMQEMKDGAVRLKVKQTIQAAVEASDL